MVSLRTLQRHRQNQAPPHVRVTQVHRRKILVPIRTKSIRNDTAEVAEPFEHNHAVQQPGAAAYNVLERASPQAEAEFNTTGTGDVDDSIEAPNKDELCQATSAIGSLRDRLRSTAGRRFRVSVEEVSEEGSSSEEDAEDSDGDWDWKAAEEESDEDDDNIYDPEPGAWDRLRSQFEREVAALGE